MFQFLETCDEILVIKDGGIVERGTHAALIEKKDQYHHLLKFHNAHQQDSAADSGVTEKALPVALSRQSSSSSSPKKRTKATEELESIVQKLTEDDTNFAGLQSYLVYIKSSGGYCFALCVFMAFCAFVFSQMFTQVWLQMWIDAGDGRNVSI